MTMMGTQVKIDYVNTDEKDMTTFINIPTNAVISGSCKSPQWISLSWNGQGGLSRALTIKANPNVTTLQEDDVQKYSVEQVSLRVEIDNETFPGMHHNVQTITASLDNQQLFETPFNKSFNCKEIILNLHTNDPVGPIAITFEDIQFQAYTDKSTFSEGVNCKSTESTDYVAIGIGVFLAATIISALASYVFCQWWRKKDRGV
ncbi:uncharacterized protein LOC124168111 [Ischnura elegans]|uniref:uncharacterized protein LOC124168111 n=1 Tax=Ischnura elegans TaxID=197161 RepID=UPI001ED89652|nr:uncharacterized protein LOC124168111 [Ischnura elegans]